MYWAAIYALFLYPIIYIFPAYAANGAPVLFGGGKPLDMKRKLMGKLYIDSYAVALRNRHRDLIRLAYLAELSRVALHYVIIGFGNIYMH